MNYEREMLDGLKALAAEEPLDAPRHVETYLLSAFRRRARQRRIRAWVTAAGTGAMAAGIAALLWLALPVVKRAPIAARTMESAPTVAGTRQAPASVESTEVRYAVVRTDDVATSFYPLPEADALPPLESAMVVRVQLPLASLQMMGYPVDEEAGADRVEADVLLGQDGLARGVRLIQ